MATLSSHWDLGNVREIGYLDRIFPPRGNRKDSTSFSGTDDGIPNNTTSYTEGDKQGRV